MLKRLAICLHVGFFFFSRQIQRKCEAYISELLILSLKGALHVSIRCVGVVASPHARPARYAWQRPITIRLQRLE